jgi:hypothetical protein
MFFVSLVPPILGRRKCDRRPIARHFFRRSEKLIQIFRLTRRFSSVASRSSVQTVSARLRLVRQDKRRFNILMPPE